MDAGWDDDEWHQPSKPVSLLWIVAAALGVLVVWLGFRPILWWQYRHIPGGSLALPFFGNLSAFRNWDLASILHWSGNKYGRHIHKVWVGSTPCIVINQPELAHHVCMRINMRFKGDVAAEHLLLPHGPSHLLDRSVLINNGSTWRQTRRAFEMAIMQPESLSRLLPVIQRHCELLGDCFSRHLHSSGTCNILQELELMNFELLGSAAYGASFRQADSAAGATHDAEGTRGGHPAADTPQQKQPGQDISTAGSQLLSRLAAAVKAVLKQAPLVLESSSPLVLLGLFMPALRLLCTRMLRRSPDQMYSRHVQVTSSVAEASAAVVEAWKADRKSKKAPLISESSLLGQLLEGREKDHGKCPKLKDEEVIAQPLAFMLAGSSLTNTLAFCIYLLSQHPHVEMKVMEEVDQAIYQASKRASEAGSALGQDAQASEQHIAELRATALRELHADDLPYTEAVLKETMRMFPSVPVLRRQAPPEGMDVDGVRIPGDAVLLIPVSNFHHDEHYFPQPGIFRPERFLESQVSSAMHSTMYSMLQRQFAATTPYAFIPFGIGARLCVGYKMSLVQGVLTLATLYSRFTFRLHPGQVPLPIHTGLVVVPSNGVWVNIRERPPWVPQLPSPTSLRSPRSRTAPSPDVPSTSADVPSTSADVPPTAADVPSTSADVPSTSADVPSTSADVPSTAADLPSTAADVPSTSAAVPSTSADVPSASAAVPSTSADVPSTSAAVPSVSTMTAVVMTPHANAPTAKLPSTSAPSHTRVMTRAELNNRNATLHVT